MPDGVEPALFVKQYESVTLKGLWPGIDLRCYSTDGTLETDWLVAPGADYSQIQFEVKGAELRTDDAGNLIMSTPFGEIREGGLKVFQAGQQLEAKWVISPLDGEVPGGVVSFEVRGHNPMLAMRIDPMCRFGGRIMERTRKRKVNTALLTTLGMYIWLDGRSLNTDSTP